MKRLINPLFWLCWALWAPWNAGKVFGQDAGTSDGGIDFDRPAIYSLCPERGPVWAVENLDGGVLVSEQQGKRINCLLDACETNRLQLETAATIGPPPPKWAMWIAGVVVAGAVGFGAGYICAKLPTCLK